MNLAHHLSDTAVVFISLVAIAVALECVRRALFRGGLPLRATLVLLLALSVVFAAARTAIERQRSEEQAAAQLLEQGLGLRWSPATPTWFWSLLGRVSGYSFRHVVAASTELKSNWTDSDEPRVLPPDCLQPLARLTWLEHIELSTAMHNGGPFITPRITDQATAQLAGLRRLESIDLSGQPLTDACVPHLAGLSSLARLDLTGTALSPAGISRLRNALPRTTILEP
jgi:hypothetical protein